MTIEIIVTSILILILTSLLIFATRTKSSTQSIKTKSITPPAPKICPLCGYILPKGKKIHSEVYPGKNCYLMHIHGCPNCANTTNPIRRCPYCGKILPPHGYVMAKLYRHAHQPHQVHIYGCTQCKPGWG